MSEVKGKIMILLKTSTTKYYRIPKRAQNVYGVGNKLRKLKLNEAIQDRTTEILRLIFKNNKKIFTKQ